MFKKEKTPQQTKEIKQESHPKTFSLLEDFKELQELLSDREDYRP